MEQPKPTHVAIAGPEKLPSKKNPGTDIETFKVTIFAEGFNDFKTYVCHSFDKAAQLAAMIASDRKIELIDNTIPF